MSISQIAFIVLCILNWNTMPRITQISVFHLGFLVFFVWFFFRLFTFSAAESWAGGPGLSSVHRATGGAWCAGHSTRWPECGQRAWLPPASQFASCRPSSTLCLGVGIYSWCRPRCASSALAGPSIRPSGAGCHWWNHREDGRSLSSRLRRYCHHRRCCYADDSSTTRSQCSATRTRVDRCDHSTRTCDGNPIDDWWVGRCVGALFCLIGFFDFLYIKYQI